ncbi:6092_t:CDS:2, partial [Racocetra persica]
MATDNDSKYNITKNNKDEQKLENTLIGHGGFAVVYRVELQNLNCVIKRLKINIYIDDETFRRIKRE